MEVQDALNYKDFLVEAAQKVLIDLGERNLAEKPPPPHRAPRSNTADSLIRSARKISTDATPPARG
jgi:hypothetical protein